MRNVVAFHLADTIVKRSVVEDFVVWVQSCTCWIMCRRKSEYLSPFNEQSLTKGRTIVGLFQPTRWLFVDTLYALPLPSEGSLMPLLLIRFYAFFNRRLTPRMLNGTLTSRLMRAQLLIFRDVWSRSLLKLSPTWPVFLNFSSPLLTIEHIIALSG